MSLGETIHRLRTEQNLSQDGLADALGVSRQSISKWETNRSVPDLDKLVKLSGVFGVTLDELVPGEAPAPACPGEAQGGMTCHDRMAPEDFDLLAGTRTERPAPAPDPVPPAPPPQAAFPPRKIAGAILLCMGFLVVLSCTLLGSLLAGLLFASPLLLCGAVCFLLRTHTGLWCAWAVCIPVDVYLRYATGINWRLTLFTPHFQPSMNYIRLATAWGQLAAMVLLVFLTAVLLRKKELADTRRSRGLLLGGWALFLLSCVLPSLLWSSQRWFAFFFAALDWGRIALLAALLVLTLRFLRGRRAENTAAC